MLTTNQKGKLAEAKVAALCLDLGLGVTWPFDDERYDMILDLRPRLLRVQCKWAGAGAMSSWFSSTELDADARG
jgi:hypothetical protein